MQIDPIYRQVFPFLVIALPLAILWGVHKSQPQLRAQNVARDRSAQLRAKLKAIDDEKSANADGASSPEVTELELVKKYRSLWDEVEPFNNESKQTADGFTSLPNIVPHAKTAHVRGEVELAIARYEGVIGASSRSYTPLEIYTWNTIPLVIYTVQAFFLVIIIVYLVRKYGHRF